MKTVEDIQVPLFSLPELESYKLFEWLVPHGSYVSMGEPIFTIEVGEELYAAESFYSGFIQICAPVGSLHKVGAVIGTMLCDDASPDGRVLQLRLDHEDISEVDGLRGDQSRIDFSREIFRRAISTERKRREQDAALKAQE